MTTTESRSPRVFGVDRIGSRRALSLAAAILLGLAILGVAVAWPRVRRDPRRLWNEAHAALASGDITTAESLLDEIGRLRTPTSLDWSLRAEIAVARDRPDEALAMLRRVPDDDRLAAQAALLAGRIELRRNRLPAAEVHLRRAIARDLRSIAARKELIFILGMQIRRPEADAAFKDLSRLTPLTHHELFSWGLSRLDFPWTEDTVDHLETFLRACPEDRHSRLAMARLLLRSRAEVARIDRVLEPLPPSDPEAAALRIASRLDRGRGDEAVAMLAAIPGDRPALARIRGRVALGRGDLDAAVARFREALAADPDDRVVLAELGKALALRGDRAASGRYLDRVRHLDAVYDLLNKVHSPDRENDPADLLRFGRAFEAAGLISLARGWYLLAIDRDPLDAEAQRALHRLKEGGP